MNYHRMIHIGVIAACLLMLTGIPPARSDTAAQQFYSAEAHYNQFIEDSELVRFRDNWLVCIERFTAAYEKDPSGTLASASLYMAGKLYQDLYYRSFLSTDRQHAIDTLRRVIKRFPRSIYRKKAETALGKFSDIKPVAAADTDAPPPVKKPAVAKNLSAPEPSPEESESESTAPVKRIKSTVFVRSKAAYHAAAAARQRKTGPAKPAPSVEDPIAQLIKVSKLDKPAVVRPAVTPTSGGPTVVQGLRIWSNPNYTRIVVDADRETGYVHELLDEDASAHKPKRLYIDFANSVLSRQIKRVIPIDDDLLISARAGQRTPYSVRVVVDIKSFKTYKIFSLSNPFRTVIDVWGRDAGTAYAERAKPVPRPRTSYTPKPKTYQASVSPDTKVTPHDLARQLALGVRRIVIDPGHGGKDVGAPGYHRGVFEKDVVLQIARRLARKIRQELGCEVIMTRDSDRFLTLEERTAIANTQNADLFISIHCNAHQNQRAYGIETYYLNLATDDAAILVAARENAISRKNISDLHSILNDLMKNAKINESSRLAAHVQQSMVGHLSKNYRNIKDKGVKQAPFYVLLGAQMPSILVETSFISNKEECTRLTSANYQEHICNGIIKGIRQYIKETSPTAFARPASRGRG